ncbi:hypothetical protein PXD04_06635 [Methanosphaera sp. ISO3-F5]|uniref:hypothetical protein n=1 Tax=Methanosphaera sp. ISO3-F5 TaxID=1452353 RepID=UPI002B25FC4C|nr:hypothetical protein [Methanosphaera sp. ISO3-F5]WQH63381.1 hypothetical protein PXD04_06635 [Methanosphaera sp. ISO3-F5]
MKLKSWAEKIFHTFEDNIENVGFMSLNVKLKNKESKEISYLIRHFAEFIKELCGYFKNEKKSLMIIIDDVNGLSRTDKFANWYKSFATKLDSYIDEDIPVGFILTSYPQNFNKFKKMNPSFTRIFNIIPIEKLSDNDVSKFYTNVFNEINMELDDKALELMVKYTFGMPLMIHEIGYNIFWLCDKNEKITCNTALTGIKIAKESILTKYLHENIANKNYKRILREISTHITPGENDQIIVPEIKQNLLEEEKDLLDVFIIESKNAGIIESIDYKVDETYEFINPLYTIFMKINNI